VAGKVRGESAVANQSMTDVAAITVLAISQ
jgi:hypothetical protein